MRKSRTRGPEFWKVVIEKGGVQYKELRFEKLDLKERKVKREKHLRETSD